MGCPGYLGTGGTHTTYGGGGWWADDEFIVIAFNAGGFTYASRHIAVPSLEEVALHDASALIGAGVFDYVEVGPGPRLFSFDTGGSALRRFALDGSGVWVPDGTTGTVEPGVHSTAYNPYDGQIWVVWYGSAGTATPLLVYTLDPEGSPPNYTGAQLPDTIADPRHHLRMTCTPDGTVWLCVNDNRTPQRIWATRADGSYDEVVLPDGPQFYGMFPAGAASVDVMLGPLPGDGVPRPAVRVRRDGPGSYSFSDGCSWFPPAVLPPAGETFAGIFSGAELGRVGSRALLVANNFVASDFGLGAPGGNGVWLDRYGSATGWVAVYG